MSKPERAASGSPAGGFRTDIQGLRAIAVLLVVLYHAGVPHLAGGYVGVDVFFVLSGFLITGLLLQDRAERPSSLLLGFYARRMRRILPAATVVLLGTLLAAYELLGFLRAGQVAVDTEWAAGFMANVHFAAEGTQYLNASRPPSPLQHYWSLGVEEQFYLVWPLLFVLIIHFLPRVGLPAKLAVVLAGVVTLSLAWSIMETNQNGTVAFFSPFTRAWELAVGAGLAVAGTSLSRVPRVLSSGLSVVGLAAVIAGAVVFDSSTPYPGSAVALPVLGTAALLVGGSRTGRGAVGSVLAWRPLQVVGALSYSLYLWHWPILTIASQYRGHSLTIWQNLGLLVFAVVLAALTYLLVENPIRRSGRLRRDQTFTLLGAACVALIPYIAARAVIVTSPQPSAAQSVVVLGGQAPSSVPRIPSASSNREISRLLSRSLALQAVPSDLVPSLVNLPNDDALLAGRGADCAASDSSVKACTFGDARAPNTIVLFGDSHAGMWLPAFDAFGRSHNWRVILMFRPGCPAATVHVFDVAKRRPDHACDDWRSSTVRAINELAPSVVVATSMFYYPLGFDGKPIMEDTWDAGLGATLSHLRRPATQLIVLGDIPYLPRDPADCLAAHEDNMKSCTVPRSSAVLADHDAAERRVATLRRARYVGVTRWFCDAKQCPLVVGQLGVYRDRAHISATYAQWLNRVVGSALQLSS